MKRKIVSLRRRRAQPLSKGYGIALATVLVLLVILIARSVQRHSSLVAWRNQLAEGVGNVPWPEWNATWPPLPKAPPRTSVSNWQGPYAFAALNSESLRHIPCYCGCRREGHRSVLDCYVKNFTPAGLPIWSDHAFTCETCVNVVREVSLMSARGMSLAEIRSSVDDYHGGVFTKSTDTPLPK